MSAIEAIDLFAGPGGTDEGLKTLGIEPLGIEWDDAACATRAVVGHRTLQADVAGLDPRDFGAPALLVGSPPCPTFSNAGKRSGLRDMTVLRRVAMDIAGGDDTRVEALPNLSDPRSLLVVEPLRWALALSPRWVALEQVPSVLPLWQLFADVLRAHGWHTWAGTLSAEQFGVPQTRERAFLLASLDGRVEPPAPTHQRYVAPPSEGEALPLFDAGPRGRIVTRGEEHLLPWVSMADALGWGMTARPYPVIASSRSTGGPDKEKVGGSGARQTIYDERAAGRWKVCTGNQSRVAGGRVELYQRSIDAPAPTLTGNTGRAWTVNRPATTIQGDPRVFSPGGHIANDGRDNTKMVGRSENAIRVELEDAAVLQGFQRDYPFQGNKTEKFQQVGNAVPPPFARAVVGALVGASLLEEAA